MLKKFKLNLLDVANFQQKYFAFVKDQVNEVKSSEILLSSEDFGTSKVFANCKASNQWTIFQVYAKIAKLKVRCKFDVVVFIALSWFLEKCFCNLTEMIG